MSKEYIVVLPIEPMREQQHFLPGESLPLHCTVMHWFRLSSIYPLPQLVQGLCQLAVLPENKDLHLVSQRPELFGPDGDVPVHVLERNEQLNLLHTRIFALLAEWNCLPEELRWIGAGYRPHVTDTQWRHFPPGTRHHARDLVLIERDEDRKRTVVSEFLLGGPPF